MDAHVDGSLIRELRRHGIDVLSVADTKMFKASDEEHLERATLERRVLFSQDADFLNTSLQSRNQCGIIYAPRNRRIGYLVEWLLLFYELSTPDEFNGRLHYL